MTPATMPASADPLAMTLGYLLMGAIFVFAGFDHLRRFQTVKALLVQRGWPSPGPILVLASVFQIVAGLGLALDVLRPWAALGLAAFTVAASVTLLDFWGAQGPARDGMRSGFVVNVGLLGGLLLAFGASL